MLIKGEKESREALLKQNEGAFLRMEEAYKMYFYRIWIGELRKPGTKGRCKNWMENYAFIREIFEEKFPGGKLETLEEMLAEFNKESASEVAQPEISKGVQQKDSDFIFYWYNGQTPSEELMMETTNKKKEAEAEAEAIRPAGPGNRRQ